MALRKLLRRFTPLRWWRVGKKEPTSMILLLAEQHFFHKDELQFAAERAWHTSFLGGGESKHCVVQSGERTLIKAGPHLLGVFHYSKPYIDNPQNNLDWLPQPSQQKAWARHRACVGIDYFNCETDMELAYSVLASLAAELVDENCTAIYIPAQDTLIPNSDALYDDLHIIASARNLGITR